MKIQFAADAAWSYTEPGNHATRVDSSSQRAGASPRKKGLTNPARTHPSPSQPEPSGAGSMPCSRTGLRGRKRITARMDASLRVAKSLGRHREIAVLCDRVQRDELIRSITTGNLIVVTGSGFSRLASGDPVVDGHRVASWNGLLAHGFDYCVRNNLQGTGSTRDVEVQLEEGQTRQLISAAQAIFGWLDAAAGKHREEWLGSSVGQLRLLRRDLVELLRALSPTLATLNYDDLLEQGTGYASLDWTQHDLITEVLRQDREPHVIHLHGSWKNPVSVVADFVSYHDIAKDGLTRRLMTNLFVFHRLLFIGCRGTFEDPHFTNVMRHISDDVGNHHHCVLCRDEEVQGLKQIIGDETMLHPLAYGTSYDDLHGFLEDLVQDSNTFLEEKARATPVREDRRRQPSLRVRKAAEIWKLRVDQ